MKNKIKNTDLQNQKGEGLKIFPFLFQVHSLKINTAYLKLLKKNKLIIVVTREKHFYNQKYKPIS